MSYVVNNLPKRLQAPARKLCAMVRRQALAGASEWEIDPETCFTNHGFVWAAKRNHCSVEVAIDERKGRVWKVTIELPDEHALSAEGGQS